MYYYRDAIRELLREGHVRPKEISETVIASIPVEDYLEIIEEIMPVIVREVIRSQRGNVLKKNRQQGKGIVQKLGVSFSSSPPISDEEPKQPVFVPGQGWLDHSELTADQCDLVADAYEELADKNFAKANEYRQLSSALREFNCNKVSDYWELISKKTTDGIAYARDVRGIKIGRPSRVSDETRSRIFDLRKAGKTLKAIADILTNEGVPTGHGAKAWGYSSVRTILCKEPSEVN